MFATLGVNREIALLDVLAVSTPPLLSVVGGRFADVKDRAEHDMDRAEMNVFKSTQAKWARWPVADVRARQIAGFLGTAAVTASALMGAPIDNPNAAAAPCPDVEVVFARGSNQQPGVGGIGQAFVDALHSQVGARSVGVYAVNYPATDFPTSAQGVDDASAHVKSMAANCPNTRIVLGGYSLGAAVIGYSTADVIPAGFTPAAGAMPVEVADHVAAVALFGKPSSTFLNGKSAPPIVIGTLYRPKTIDLCAPGDPICSQDGNNSAAHTMYAANGMTDQAAVFTASRL
jgi:cutinase